MTEFTPKTGSLASLRFGRQKTSRRVEFRVFGIDVWLKIFIVLCRLTLIVSVNLENPQNSGQTRSSFTPGDTNKSKFNRDKPLFPQS
jgi:hypothetical protein